MKYFLAVDIGGTKINAGLINKKGEISAKKRELTIKKITPKKLINQVINLAEGLLSENGISKREIQKIGIAVPGPVDLKKGLVIHPPNLKGICFLNLVKPIKKIFRKQVFLLNDANAAALAEVHSGAGKGASQMLYLTLSTGIGGGIIINKKLYQGQGFAGELGHQIIDLNGRKCNCNNCGCFEALCSGGAITRKTGLHPRIVYKKAREGNKKALRVVEENNKNLAIGLVNLVHIFNPEKIILGGGMMKDADLILSPVRKIVRKKIMPAFRQTKLEINKAKLGEDGILLGLYFYSKFSKARE